MILSKTEMHIDVVCCIDGSKWMKPRMDACKEAIALLREQIEAAGADIGPDLGSLRAKTIVFRNYECDEDPMVISPWYDLFEEQGAFQDHVRSIDAHGGGAGRRMNGLEALYLAVHEDFRMDPPVRQLIVLFSNNDALYMPEGERPLYYPANMGGMGDLINGWLGFYDDSTKLRRETGYMFLLAPGGTVFEMLANVLDPEPVFFSLPFNTNVNISEFFSDAMRYIYCR